MNFENMPNPIEEEKIGFENCSSFDELYRILREQEEIEGTIKKYNSAELIKIIEQVRHGHKGIGFVTRSYGLRDLVEKLLSNDRIYNKYKHD